MEFSVRKFFGALTILTFFIFSCMASCPPLNVTVPLNISQFAGEWSMIAGSATSGNSVSKCCQFTITETAPDTFHLIFAAISRRSNRPVTFTANVTVGDDVIGNWQLQGSDKILGPMNHRILDVKYDSYIAMIVCGNNNPNLPNGEFALILSRDISLSSKILQKLKEKISPYIAMERILNVDRSKCIAK